MIDWVSCIIKCDHNPDKLFSGLVASINKDGEIDWSVNKRMDVEGSYSSNIQIKSINSSKIYISGNPTKFLQGHNLFGTNDLNYLMKIFFNDLLKRNELGLHPTIQQYSDIQNGDYQLTRIDVNETWHLDNEKDVLAWIRAVGSTAYMKHRGAGQFSGDTAYFGKNSRRWALKCYSKFLEILQKGHHLPKNLQILEMMEYARKALRIEGVTRQLELKRRGLELARNWNVDTPKVLLLEYISKLELSDVHMLKDDILDNLPTRLRMVYQTWLNGDDLKQIMSKSAFYRYRSKLLKHGIDISTNPSKEKNNIIPLIRVLEAQPVGIPYWAYKLNLVI